MQKAAKKLQPGPGPQPEDKIPSEKVLPEPADFAERNDDPEQARELERQQDA